MFVSEHCCCRLLLSLAVVAVHVEAVILLPETFFEILNPRLRSLKAADASRFLIPRNYPR